MSAIPTFKIRAGDSFAIINVADFDPDQHKVFLEPEVLELSALSEALRNPPPEPETGTATSMPPEATVVNNATVAYHPVEAERVWVDPGPYVEMSIDPPSVETITEPSEAEAAPAPEPSKQYRPGQFTPKRGPGRPRKQ